MNKPIFIAAAVLSALGIGLFVFTITTNELHKKNKRGKDVGAIQKFADDLKNIEAFQREDHELDPELIETYTKQVDVYQKESQKITRLLKTHNKNLSAFYRKLNINDKGLPNRNRFASTYNTELRKLSALYIKNCGASPEVDSQEISKSLSQVSYLQKWGEKTPDESDLKPAMRQFNILKTLYESLKNVGIHHIEKLSINTLENTRRSRNNQNTSKNSFYTPVPVSLTCELGINKITRLLSSILKNEDLVFQIDDFVAEKTEGFQSDDKTKQLKNGLKVTLNLKVLEFLETPLKKNQN